jgi:hypothetical protein
LSEHALANAFDVSEFVFASGMRISVAEAWPKMVAPPVPTPKPPEEDAKTETVATSSTSKSSGSNLNEVTEAKASAQAPPKPPPVAEEPKPDPTSSFVRKVHDDACKTFGTILGPDADAAHKTHFHLDMKARHHSSFCQ